jgi:adenylate kinase
LKERFHVPHISSGDLLRAAIEQDTPLGREAKAFMDRGELVPDELLLRVMEERLQEADCRRGFILDGFPRTLAQADALDAMLRRMHAELDGVVSISVPRSELLRRMSGRRTCRRCGASYHIVFNPPRLPGVCDRCQGNLCQREDDKETTIGARLDVYERQTAPLLALYDKRGILRTIDGVGEQAQILDRVLGVEPVHG